MSFINEMKKFVNQRGEEAGIPNLFDQKMFSIQQVADMIQKAATIERQRIERDFILIHRTSVANVKAPEGSVLRADHFAVGTKSTPVPLKPKAEERRLQPMPNQWNDDVAICKGNVENAVVVLRNRGKTEATVREISEVILKFVPAAFSAGRRMIDYRHRLTKKYLSSDKKLLGQYPSKMVKGQYVFSI